MIADLVLEYYWLLRSVLRTKPRLRACLTRCRHCGIFFLTHPRNAGRHNLRCPFGCREGHRRQQSTQRSVAYYRDLKGKKKKAQLNNKRRCKKPSQKAKRKVVASVRAGPGVSAPPDCIVRHVAMVAGLIESRRVSRRQVRLMLSKKMRQLTIGTRRRIDQAVLWLKEHPP